MAPLVERECRIDPGVFVSLVLEIGLLQESPMRGASVQLQNIPLSPPIGASLFSILFLPYFRRHFRRT
jgi:hypothetical protein